jgi:pantoate--beta-alanine ligase
MKILKNISVLKRAITNITNLGFVPTMGSFHSGHISLIKKSLKKCKKTLVSIYINPRQFNNKNDFLKYPRNMKKDLTILKKIKVDYVFTPNTKEIYKKKRLKKIILPKSQRILCAKFRKGHFEGVIDIMDRFINLIKPKYVFMGEKDFQQLYLLKNYVSKKYKSKIYGCKTVRDRNNVALSSRNYLLSQKNLYKAGLISAILKKAKYKVIKEHSIDRFLVSLKEKLIKKFKIKIEYLELRNQNDLKSKNIQKKNRIFIAYYLNNVRLIDNY